MHGHKESLIITNNMIDMHRKKENRDNLKQASSTILIHFPAMHKPQKSLIILWLGFEQKSLYSHPS